MTDLDATLLIDDHRSAHLCDVGLPGCLAVTAVGSDGDTVLLVADAELIGDPDATVDPHCADARHDQTGPLPPAWRSRIWSTPLRCGRRTASGGRCRIPVRCPGQACGWHRRAP
ncbi:MAG: hypothetical protein QJR12_09475 [Mycobacterium sp.]|uniref:hypothetical protein n=1 Tax=Mycobacterium sp. TaxID=1785 RepID=UPI002612303F|nr:hypothetical protein [Mycobacterium sp.]MDI3314490.1 hypothetical protein [Mycobacterium sp.]